MRDASDITMDLLDLSYGVIVLRGFHHNGESPTIVTITCRFKYFFQYNKYLSAQVTFLFSSCFWVVTPSPPQYTFTLRAINNQSIERTRCNIISYYSVTDTHKRTL